MACSAHLYCASGMESFKSKDSPAAPGSVMNLFMVAWLPARQGYPKCGCCCHSSMTRASIQTDEGIPKARRQCQRWVVWLCYPIIRLLFIIHAYISYRKIRHREVITPLLLCKISKFVPQGCGHGREAKCWESSHNELLQRNVRSSDDREGVRSQK